MFINDFENTNGYKLHQIMHTLKSVHGVELKLDEATEADLEAIRQSSEIIKNSIVSESQFNTYNNSPEYTKHTLIMEAVRLYLTEIAPKRSKKSKVKENAVPAVAATAAKPASSATPAKPQPGTVKVKKNNDEKTVPAAQLTSMQQQGYSVVGDDEVEENRGGSRWDPELLALMKEYGVDPNDDSEHKGMNESTLNEAKFDHDSYQASMARSELYRNTKYAMDMMRIIRPEDDVQPWIVSNLVKAAEYLDKIFHYMDYYTKFEPQQLPEDEDMDPDVSEMELGETTGSTARENLLMIVEYSTKLFNLIQPGDKLEGWVAMKLTSASNAVSNSKHYLEYVQFEKNASDHIPEMGAEDTIEEAPSMKKKIKESVGQMLMRMMVNEDQDLAQAQALLAAKSLSDDLMAMAEKVSKMSIDDLMPLVDTMKEQFGTEAADGYNEMMKQTLEALLKATTNAKETSDNAITQLQGGQIPGQAEPEAGAEAAPEAPAVPGEEGGEVAAPEVPEEPLGRAKKGEEEEGGALAEAWETKMKTAEKDKGKWDGYTIAELRAKKKKLMDKESRTAAEQKTVKQIDFAIRAKQKDKWGKVDEAKKAKPDFLDVDKDGDKKEPMKKALKDKAKKVAESAPPGKKAEEFIKGAKADFIKRYGKEKGMSRLYATAWKKFGDKSEGYVKAERMLESNTSMLAKMEAKLDAHKRSYARMVNEGQAEDPLNIGYGLEGEVIMDQMGDLSGVIAKLKEMIKAEIRQGAAELIVAEQRRDKANTLESAKAKAPWGVAWKSRAGSTQSKFFESQSDRDYWVGLKDLREARLINPDHFDKAIDRLSSKKG